MFISRPSLTMEILPVITTTICVICVLIGYDMFVRSMVITCHINLKYIYLPTLSSMTGTRPSNTDMVSFNNELPSSSLFYEVWVKDFPHLRIPPANCLGKCPVCLEYDVKIKNAKTQSAKKDLRKKRAKHKATFQKEREYLMAMASLAGDCPTELHFVGIDAMNPLHMPHLCELPKNRLTKRCPKMHVYGVMDWLARK